MTKARALIAVVLLLSVLTSCGKEATTAKPEVPAFSGTTKPTTTPTTSPAPTTAAVGARIPGAGYTLRIPRQWRNLTKAVRRSNASVNLSAGSLKAVNGSADNLTVVITNDAPKADAVGLSRIAKLIQKQFAEGSPRLRVLDQTRIDGSPAAHLAGPTVNGKKPWLELYVAIHRKRTFLVIFSMEPEQTPAQRSRTIASIMKSWSWTS